MTSVLEQAIPTLDLRDSIRIAEGLPTLKAEQERRASLAAQASYTGEGRKQDPAEALHEAAWRLEAALMQHEKQRLQTNHGLEVTLITMVASGLLCGIAMPLVAHLLAH